MHTTGSAADGVDRIGAELPSLTGVRWLAALWVFGFHVVIVEYATGPLGTALEVVFGAGSAGVSLFFVLSGFVLAWSHDDRTPTGRFYFRRFARVWPSHAVWVVVAVVTVATVPVLRHPGGGAVADLANLGLLSAWVPGWWQAGNAVAWSLVCEAFFYAVFPLLWRVSAVVRSRRALAAVAAGCFLAVWGLPVVVSWVGLRPSWHEALHFPLARLPEFVLGVLAAVAMRRGVWRGPRLVPSLAVALGSCIGTTWAGAVPGVTVVGFVLLVAALARRDLTGRATVLGGRWAGHLGRVSFAFYLCHLLVIGVVGAVWSGGHVDGHPRLGALPASGLIVLALVVSLVLAAVTHHVVELPARRWLVDRRAGRADTDREIRGQVGDAVVQTGLAPHEVAHLLPRPPRSGAVGSGRPAPPATTRRQRHPGWGSTTATRPASKAGSD